MIDCVIRPACLDDAEALQKHCYTDASLDKVRTYLAWCLRQREKGRIVRLVAKVNGQAVGNVQLTVWGSTGEIGSLIVGQAYRRQGLARRMLSSLIDRAQELGLDALELDVSTNEPDLQAFYRRLGFEPSRDKKKGLSHSASSDLFVRLRMLL